MYVLQNDIPLCEYRKEVIMEEVSDVNKKRNRRVGYSLVIVLLLLLFIGFGYAFLSQTLEISGTTGIGSSSWDVHFEDLRVTSGSVTATSAATIDTNKTSVNFEVPLSMPGDFYEFTVNVVNKGTIPAKVSAKPTLSGVSTDQDVYVNYTVTYSDNTEIAADDKLDAGATATFKVRVEYDENITSDQLPTTEQSLNLGFSIDYVQQ